MKFSTFTAFALAGSAFASPVAKVQRQEQNPPPQPGLLTEIAPAVALLVSGLGLGALAPGLSGLLGTLSEDVKRSDIPIVGDLPVAGQMISELPVDLSLPDLSSEGLSTDQVKQAAAGLNRLVSRLQLSNLQGDQLIQIQGIAQGTLVQVADSVRELLKILHLQQLAPGLSNVPVVGGIAGSVAKRQSGNGLLADAAPHVLSLVTALGLGSLGPALVSLLGALNRGV